MNQVFASKIPDGNTGLSEGGDGQSLSLLAMSKAPGTIPSTVNPPKPNLSQPDEPVVAVTSTSSAPATRVASAAPTAQSDGFFSSLARKVGIGGSADAAPPAAPPPPAAAKPKAVAAKPQSVVRVAPKPETRQAAAKPALKPSVTDAPAAAPAAASTQVAGSAPIVSSNSFDSRFGAVK
jgi:hypothetical protein